MKYLQFSWFLLPWLGRSGAFLMVPTSPSFTTGTIPTRVRGRRSNNMPLLSLPNQHSLRMISTTEEAVTDNKAEMEHASSKTNVGDHTSTKSKTSILGNKPASPLSFLDMNGDGKIDIQDLKVLAEKVGELMDLNGDGKVDGQDLKIAFQNMLDVNGDGKVDGQDIQFLTSKLQDSMYNILDVNNDGKVDREDAKTALTLALISGVLLTSPLPAHAKGGGGHSSSHSSSRSSSSRSRSHSSSFHSGGRPSSSRGSSHSSSFRSRSRSTSSPSSTSSSSNSSPSSRNSSNSSPSSRNSSNSSSSSRSSSNDSPPSFSFSSPSSSQSSSTTSPSSRSSSTRSHSSQSSRTNFPSSHNSSHSPSSSRRSSSSRYDPAYDQTIYVSEKDRSYPDYYRPHRPGFPSLDPKICFDLPKQGERIEILRDEYTGYYVPAAVVDVNDSTWACRFTAAPFDGNRPVSLHSFPNHWLYESLTIFIIIYGEDFLQNIVETIQEVQFDAQFNALPTPVPDKSTRPLESGTFRGASYDRPWHYIDSDVETIEQDVETMLQFMENGDISGSGFDSVDGEYELSGMWKVAGDGSSYLLRWKETYDDFDVKVQCDMKMSDINDADEDNQTWVVNGYFRSSRDVKGYFNMEL